MATLENGFRYFANDEKQMLVIYNEEAIYNIVEMLEDMEVEKPIIIYVFSPSNDAWEAEFETVSDKVRLTALPSAIYNAYKRVLPKPKDLLLNPKQEKLEPTSTAHDSLFDFDDKEEGGDE